MTDELTLEKRKADHEAKRKKRQKKLESTPMRSQGKVKVPASAQVVLQSAQWYQNFAKLSLFALLSVSVCAVVVSLALAFVATRPPETLSYLMDEDGRVVKMASVRTPSVTDSELLGWAAEKILAIHSLNFTDYYAHVQSLKSDFTASAFIEYQKALINSKSLEKVQNGRLVMWAEPIEAPKIIKHGESGGRYTWIVEMKIKQSMGGGNFAQTGSELLATMTIQRTSRSRNLSGVVITQYLVKEI